jgi:2-dehydro-3-deoxyphosphogluconate aldolase/(4S)-4-hydroxy-2-oxoglutarate aldolase
MDATKLLSDSFVVPVIVLDDPQQAVPMAEVLAEAGLSTLEITLRTPNALKVIETIATKLPGVIVGAGSVLTARQFNQANNAGARFVVSPGSSEALLESASRLKLPFVPGANTATEVINLQDRGYTLTKFFPAELAGGIRMLKALGAPMPNARFFPTGGITPELASDYLALPNVGCIGGTWLTPSKLLESGDFKAIAKLATQCVKAVR